jgi:hypothetical protein
VRNDSLTGADVTNLRSGDIANGALLAEDFGQGQLPRAMSGRAAQATRSPTVSARLPCPPQAWVSPSPTRARSIRAATSLATFRAIAPAEATTVQCSLMRETGDGQRNIDLDALDDRKAVTLLATRVLDAPTDIRLTCKALTGAGYNITHGRVVACRLRKFTDQTLTQPLPRKGSTVGPRPRSRSPVPAQSPLQVAISLPPPESLRSAGRSEGVVRSAEEERLPASLTVMRVSCGGVFRA